MHIFPIIVICSALLTACGKEETNTTTAPAEDGTTATWPASKETKDGNFEVTLKPTKGEILENEHFSLDLIIDPVSDDAGAFEVKVDADMPAHEHGMNTLPELVSQGKGSYRVDGMLFHMAGEWVITIDITSNGATERASFPVQVE